MKFLKHFFISISLFMTLFSGSVSPSYAIDCANNPDNLPCTTSGLSAPDKNQIDPALVAETDLRKQTIKIINYFLGFLGLLAVVMIVYGGVLMVTDAGEGKAQEKAKKIIEYAAIGVIIILSSYAIVNFIIGVGGPRATQGGSSTSSSSSTTSPAVGVRTAASTPSTSNSIKALTASIQAIVNRIATSGIASPADIQALRDLISQLANRLPQLSTTITTVQQVMSALDALAAAPSDKAVLQTFVTQLNALIAIAEGTPEMVATFTATPGSGYAPLNISLDGSDSTDPQGMTIPNANFIWSYRDQNGQTVTLPSGMSTLATLNTPGTYIITLTVTTGNMIGGMKSAIDGSATIKIKVLEPAAQIVLTANGHPVTDLLKLSESEAKTSIVFDPTRTEPRKGRTLTSFTWNWGDGTLPETFSAADRVMHLFKKSGTYPASLTIVDNTGNKAVKNFRIYINSIVSDFTSLPENGTVADSFEFDAGISSSSNGAIARYQWQILDKENTTIMTSDKIRFIQTFAQAGNYKVRLDITDLAGKTDTKVLDLHVKSRTPTANFTIKQLNASHPATFVFSASSSNSPDSLPLQYSWDFDGDGTTDKEGGDTVATYTFKKIGSFKARLTVRDEFGENDTKLQNVNVTSILEVDFKPNKAALQKGEEVTLNITSNNAVSYFWDFGNGEKESKTDTSTTHRFEKSGTSLVSLTAFDSDGNQTTATKKIYVGDGEHPVAAPRILLAGKEISATDGLCKEQQGYELNRVDLVTFDAGESVNIDGGKQGMSYSWSFGDGEFGNQKASSHRFTELSESCLTARLTLKDLASGKSVVSDDILLKVVNLAPTLSQLIVTLNDKKPKTPAIINLAASGARDPDGQIVRYRWWYTAVGSIDERGVVTTTQPQASVVVTSDGISDTEQSYQFVMEMTDSDGEKVLSTDLLGPSIEVPVKNGANAAPTVELNVDKDTIFVGDTVTFSASASDAKGSEMPSNAYKWDFNGDGLFEDTSSGPEVSRRYDMAGDFNARLKVSVNGLSTSKTVKIHVDPTTRFPEAAYTYQVKGTTVFFDGTNSRIDPAVSGGALRYQWDFDTAIDTDGNGVKDDDVDSGEKITRHIFPGVGQYEVQLSVLDSEGKKDKTRRIIKVTGGNYTSDDIGQRGGRSENATIRLSSTSHPITTVEASSTDTTIEKNGTTDITAVVKPSNGKAYDGNVTFSLLEGSAYISPATVSAVSGKATTTIRALAEGDILLKVEATDLPDGTLSDRLVIHVTTASTAKPVPSATTETRKAEAAILQEALRQQLSGQ